VSDPRQEFVRMAHADESLWSLNRALHFVFARQRNSSGAFPQVHLKLTR